MAAAGSGAGAASAAEMAAAREALQAPTAFSRAPMPAPTTETPNDATMDLDVAGPHGIIRMIRQADAQIFAGWRGYEALTDESLLDRVEQAVAAVAAALTADDGVIVMTGCGTSGRMAFWAAREFNKALAEAGLPPRFKYLISGGDPALLLSDELPEDDAVTGARELEECVGSASTVVLIGITCGISAPYVMGQLHWTMGRAGYTSVLMGFNPVAMARDVPIEGWHSSCRDVAVALAEKADAQHIILNPIIGPEPVTGSTRMKGGTTTKVLLELVLALAMARVHKSPLVPLSPAATGASADAVAPADDVAHTDARAVLQAFELTYHRTYQHAGSIARLMVMACASLRAGGHLYYVGGPQGGLLGLIDASEMPDTYGAPFSETRGFCGSGWPSVGNVTGDLHDRGDFFRVGLKDFDTDIVPTLAVNDTVIFVHIEGEPTDELRSLADKCNAHECSIGLVSVRGASNGRNVFGAAIAGSTAPAANADIDAIGAAATEALTIRLPFLDLLPGMPAFGEIACKWALNLVSTGMQIMKGAVYENRMINVGVLNNKLFYRSQALICKFSGAEDALAHECLLKSIHEVDELTDEITALPVSRHIEIATPKSNVVPIAMLMGTGKFSREEAKKALAAEPVIRNIAKKLLADRGLVAR